MKIEKMAILNMKEISCDTIEWLLEIVTHENTIACIDVPEGFIINIDKITYGDRHDSGIPEIDDLLPKVNAEGLAF